MKSFQGVRLIFFCDINKQIWCVFFVFSFYALGTDNNRNFYMQTDIEKNFVAYIMKETRDIHEQDDVAKDNELRRASFF